MTRNNVCNSLIVYGSWCPGGENYHVVSDLPGEWRKGFILVGGHSKGDDIYSGEDMQIEAWIIQFSDGTAEMFTEEWEAQKRILFERWNQLDIEVGTELERDQTSWWPEGEKPIRGNDSQQVVNVYLPRKNFDYLKNIKDTPHPEDEYDSKKLWFQQLSGQKKYDDHEFIALIKDFTCQECQEMFATLPSVKPFLDKLSLLYQDMAYESGYLLKQTEEGFYLYAIPRPEHAITSTQAVDLVQKDIQQKCSLLEQHEALSDAELLRKVTFQIGTPPEDESDNYETEEALEEVNEMINEPSYSLKDHWKYCLLEACYGIAANYAVRDFLMCSFYDIKYDFTIPYDLWKGGWSYKIHDTVCYIVKN